MDTTERILYNNLRSLGFSNKKIEELFNIPLPDPNCFVCSGKGVLPFTKEECFCIKRVKENA